MATHLIHPRTRKTIFTDPDGSVYQEPVEVALAEAMVAANLPPLDKGQWECFCHVFIRAFSQSLFGVTFVDTGIPNLRHHLNTKRLRELIKEKFGTAKALAYRMRIREDRLSCWVRTGRIKSYSNILSLACYLEVDPMELIDPKYLKDPIISDFLEFGSPTVVPRKKRTNARKHARKEKHHG